MKGFRESRPFPVDPERKERCGAVLHSLYMTQADLASLTGLSTPYISALLLGRELSPKNEARVAAVLGVPADYLFPQRSVAELAALRKQEEEAKARRARLRAAREELRRRTADAESA